MSGFDGWEPIGEPIGKEGQGIVYRARSPERVSELRRINERIGELLRSSGLKDAADLQSEFAQKIVAAGSPDPVSSIGALKQFAIPTDDIEEATRAFGRLDSEVQALKK